MKKKSVQKAVVILSTVALLAISLICYYNFFVIDGKIIEVEANPEKGFNFNYYIYLPNGMKADEIRHLLVEPNNTGSVSDDHNVHAKDALKLIKFGPCHTIARNLRVPLLVPIFDRPKSNWRMYTHALDRDTLMNKEGNLARVDLQLINMINDLKPRLREQNITVYDKVFMTGFSASGNFVNRFTALHPELLQAVATGGVNCMPILPVAQWEEQKLIYPIGVYDVGKITGVEFSIESYRKVAQYIYMGSLDENDTLPFDDAFNNDERELIKGFLGTDMHARWQKSKNIYRELNIPATLVMYDGVGHTINKEIVQDIISFFQENAEAKEG